MDENKSKKLLITGNDSDSGVIAFLAKIAFGGNIDIVHSGNSSDADKTIRREILQLSGFEKYDTIFIAKITFSSQATIDVIEDISREFPSCKILYINHQAINKYLADKSWTRIETEIDGQQVMSADIFYKMLREDYQFKGNDWIDNLVNVSRQYGLYEWRKTGDLLPRRFNDFYFSKLPKDFVFNMLEKYYMKSDLISLKEMEDIIKKEEDYKSLLERKKNEIEIKRLTIEDKEYKVAFIQSDEYVSELGYDIATDTPNVDMTAIITSSYDKIRFRRGANNDNIDVSVVARAFGGNGNPAAAGCRVTPEIQKVLKGTITNTLLKLYKLR